MGIIAIVAAVSHMALLLATHTKVSVCVMCACVYDHGSSAASSVRRTVLLVQGGQKLALAADITCAGLWLGTAVASVVALEQGHGSAGDVTLCWLCW